MYYTKYGWTFNNKLPKTNQNLKAREKKTHFTKLPRQRLAAAFIRHLLSGSYSVV